MINIANGKIHIEGTNNELTLSIPNGYKFVGWSDGDKQKSREITVTSDTTFVAYFAAIIYLITAEAENSQLGNVTGGGENKWGE